MIGRSGERGSGVSLLAARHDDDVYIYMYIYIFKRVYLGSELLFRQVLLKTMEYRLLFLIVILYVFQLFFLFWDPDVKGIVP